MTGFRRYLLRRLVLFFFVIVAVLTILFAILRILPGDPTSIFVDSNFSEEMVRQHPFQWYVFEPFFRSSPVEGSASFEERPARSPGAA